MLALAESVGEQTAPLVDVLDAQLGRRVRTRSRPRARRRVPPLLGRAPRDPAHAQPGRAGRRPTLPRRAQLVAAADHRRHLAQGRRERRAGVAPYAAAAALVAMMERMAAFHGRPRAVRRNPRRRGGDDGPDRVPDRHRSARVLSGVSRRVGGQLELAVEDLLEQLPLAPRAPELELRITVGAEPQQHE